MQKAELVASFPHWLAQLKNSLGLSAPVKSIDERSFLREVIEPSRGNPDKELADCFSFKEFEALGLTEYFPRMYRGLPRLYHRNFPARSHVKRQFAHLPSLKIRAATKAICSLYEGTATRGKVTLFASITEKSDASFALEAFYLLQQKLVFAEVRFVALVDVNVDCPMPQGVCVIKGQSSLSREALFLLRGADVILQMPRVYPEMDELMVTLEAIHLNQPMPKVVTLGGFGMGESSLFSPRVDGFSMGLHGLEQGVLLLRKETRELENGQLKEWRHIENRFFFASLSTAKSGAIYLHALLKSLESDAAPIDLCTPDLSWFLQMVEMQQEAGRPILEWNGGISSIEIYSKDKHYVLPIAEKGKALRLLAPSELSTGDKRVLLQMSEGWIGVSDQESLSIAIQMGKPFFYDLPESGRFFLKDIAALAENRLRAFPATLSCIKAISSAFLYKVDSQEGEWVDETFFQPLIEWKTIAKSLGNSLLDPAVIAGYQMLSSIITNECSARKFLVHLVERGLCQAKNPQIAKLEAEELHAFGVGALSFSTLIKSTRAIL